MPTAGTQPCARCADLEQQLVQLHARVSQLEAHLAAAKKNSTYTAQASPPPAAINQTPAAPDTSVVFDLRVPADAEVWFNDGKTEQTGAFRQFVTPPLTPRHAGVYDIRCRWQQNGRPMEQTRQVSVHAGERFTINFSQ